MRFEGRVGGLELHKSWPLCGLLHRPDAAETEQQIGCPRCGLRRPCHCSRAEFQFGEFTNETICIDSFATLRPCSAIAPNHSFSRRFVRMFVKRMESSVSKGYSPDHHSGHGYGSHDAFLKGSAEECSAGEWEKDLLLTYSSADNSRFGFPLHPCFGCGGRAGPLR
jgi:hypothetical protein